MVLRLQGLISVSINIHLFPLAVQIPTLHLTLQNLPIVLIVNMDKLSEMKVTAMINNSKKKTKGLKLGHIYI